MKRWVLLVLVVVILAGCVVAAYWNAPKGTFIWDDINLIVFDYQIKSWNFLENIFERDFFGFSDDNRKYGYYRPLVTISYAIDWRLWENDAAGYHWTNNVIHFLATLLVFFIFYRLAGRQPAVPLLAAAIFAVHPIHTESVTWIAGRTDPICAVFYFASLLAFMVFVERLTARYQPEWMPPGADPHAARKSYWWPGALSLLLFAGAVLGKEMAVSLPLVAAMYVLVFVTGFRQPRRWLLHLPMFVAQLGVVGGYFLFRYMRVGFSQQAKDPFQTVTTILSFIKTIGYYTLKTFVPVHLSAYIQNPLVESVLDPGFLAGFVFLALLIGVILLTLQRDKLVSFSLAFYLLSLLPLSNLIRISGPKDMGFMTAERFLYIPSAPLLFLAALYLFRLIGRVGGWVADRDWSANKTNRRAVAGALTALILVSYTVLTIKRNTDWYQNETLFTQMIDDAPNATLLYVVLGNIYRMNHQYDKAEKVLNKALEYIAPRDREEPTWIYNDLAGIYAEQRRFDEALQLMKLASRTRMHNSAVLYNYGEIYRSMGDCRSAVEYYQRSLTIQRDNRAAFIKMGLCYQQRQQWELANKAYFAALDLTPHSANLLNQIGFDYLRMDNQAKAQQYLDEALKEKPGYVKARLNLAHLRFREGSPDKAIAVLEELVAERPNSADVQATLGYMLAQTGRLPEAGEHIRRALQIDPKHVQARLTLATVNIEKNPAAARQILSDLLKDVPNHVESTFAMGLAYLADKDYDNAALWFEKTLKINPRNEAALSELKAMGRAPHIEESPPAVEE